MTLDLCDALREHLETSLKNIKLQTRGADLEKDGPARNLKIIDGYLPTKEEDSEDPYPFVLVRANSAQLSPRRSQTEVSIVIGTYGKDSVGYRDAVNVLDAVVNSIIGFAQLPLKQKFHLVPELDWQIIKDQPWPYWQLELKTLWGSDFPMCVPAGLPNITSGSAFSTYDNSLQRALYG